MSDLPQRYRFPPALRLHGQQAFAAVFAGRCRKHAGPLAVCGLPNGLPYNRLGISIGRRSGNAVVRNRIKRLLREAFRLSQHDWPRGYDLVVVPRPHEPLNLAAYQHLLRSAVAGIDQVWHKRQRRQSEQTS